MKRRKTYQYLSTLATIYVFCLYATAPKRALAYGHEVHFKNTDMAWQAMRAASDPALINNIDFKGPSPGDSLGIPGACAQPNNRCGQTVSQAEWSAFLGDIVYTLGALNNLENDVKAPGNCTVPPQSTKIEAFDVDIGWGHYGSGKDACETNVSYNVPYIYSFVQLPVLDGDGRQGRVLGWHAKHRDDDLDESFVKMNPLGGPVEVAGNVFESAASIVFLAILCVISLFGGSTSCDPEDAEALASKVNVFNALKTIMPFIPFPQNDMLVGMWHFINGETSDFGNTTNHFEDRRGLYYPEAGPGQKPSAIDEAITVVSEPPANITLAPGLFEFQCKGPDRYQFGDNEPDNHAPGARHKERFFYEWEEPIGRLEFNPLDNFGYYGTKQFRIKVDNNEYKAEPLGWGLHAIGDVTVPHHVLGTSGYGHVPYEEWVSKSWEDFVYIKYGGTENQQYVNQYDQAHRILEHAYRWWGFLKNGHGVRDLITEMAKETRDYGDFALCEECTVVHTLTGVLPGEVRVALEDDIGHAALEALIGNVLSKWENNKGQGRELLERSIGAEIAYLMMVAELMAGAACGGLGDACTTDDDCCSAGYECEPATSQCCALAGYPCQSVDDCCGADVDCDEGMCYVIIP